MRMGRLGDARFAELVSPLSARRIMIRCRSAFVCYWLLQCWRPLMVRSLWRSLISEWELATIRMRLPSVSSQAVVTLLVDVL